VPVRSNRLQPVDVVLWALACASAGLTAWFSLWNVPPTSTAFPHVDKVQHLVAYVVTSSLIFLAAVWRPGRGPGPFARWPAAVALLLVAGAGVVELLQAALEREAELWDWLAGTLGVALALAGTMWLRRRYPT